MSQASSIQVGPGGMVVALDPEALRSECIARGWSLAELARRARISRPTLAQALRGQTVRPSTAFKLAVALEREDSAAQLSAILRGS